MPAVTFDDYSLALPYPVAATIIDQSLDEILAPYTFLCGAEYEEVSNHAPRR